MSCDPDDICIGPYVVGEIPPPIEYQYLDASGVSIPITGYGVRFVYRELNDTVATTRTGVLTDAVHGIVTYVWVVADFATPGHYVSEFWVGNGTQRYASVRITYNVRAAVGPIPAI